MNYSYNPSSEQEKFAVQVYNLLAKNFGTTFFVGGMVRDLLLNKLVTDIDIATIAKPEEVAELLKANKIELDNTNSSFGVVIAKGHHGNVEITTLRQDSYDNSRYPKVDFISNPGVDSNRRDFTINALYLDLQSNQILDFHNGLQDLENKIIKFIGDAEQRIIEDPLRIVRAYRFQLALNFIFDAETKNAIQKLHSQLKNISVTRISNEINKISDQKIKLQLKKVIHNIS